MNAPFASTDPLPSFQTACKLRRWIVSVVAALCLISAGAVAQDKTDTQKEQPKLPHPTTTVEVHETVPNAFVTDALTAGTLDGQPLSTSPVTATVVTRSLLSDQDARVLSDVVKNNAAIGEDYAPVGYYGDFQIRGFPIDLATGWQINGMTVAGEQDVPLENKERVEFVEGVAGVENGVASAGGLIDFVTKRPAAVKAMDLATDHRGSAFGAADLGWLFGSAKQVGTRFNLAGERIKSYVNGADGWRAMGAGAADWKLNERAVLKGDFEYQHKNERSVSGYQLLGGTTVPDLNLIAPSTMLGFQIWEKPNTFDTFNTSTRLDYELPRGWRAYGEASLSHSLIDDNVVYAYGTSFDESGNVSCPGAPDAPYYFFCPDGTYGIYDYRNPGELRMNGVASAMALGAVNTGAVRHNIAAGGELFSRSVRMPGFWTVDNPASPDGVVQNGAVFWYVGSQNIYEPVTPVDLNSVEDPHQQAGPRRLYEDDHQASGIVQDRVELPWRVQLIAAARFDRLHDHNYSLWATNPQNETPLFTDKWETLPEYAVTWSPVAGLMLYGNYGVMLSLGQQAPFWTDNGSQFLSPYRTRQAEVGAKVAPGQRMVISADYFHMRAPFFYPKSIDAPDAFCTASEFYGPGDLCFEMQGHETHDGGELNAQGTVTRWLKLTGSAVALKAISEDTGTPEYDGKQVINVPQFRATAFAEVDVKQVPGLAVMPGWSYTGLKDATRDDAVSVPGYNLVNLGVRYTPGGEKGRITLRLYADNVGNKRYWKDTGASLGDTFIHLGAPATVRLSAHYAF
jgi:iron complex outermembrane receptor protein